MLAEYDVGPAAEDLSGVGALYADAGFRPDLVSDLAFVRSLGGSVFTATHGGVVVGASSCLPFVGTGWVGGVAVEPAHGRKGLGGRLTRVAVDALRAGGATTILLHATPMAAELYGRMGFVREAEFVELAGPPPGGAPAGLGIRGGRSADLGAVLALDRQVTGEDRGTLLCALWPGAGLVHDDGVVRGFQLPQSPSAVGAIVASEDAVGELLLRAALGRRLGPTRVPIPKALGSIDTLLRDLGYTEHIRTTRMRLGPPIAFHPRSMFSAFNLYWG